MTPSSVGQLKIGGTAEAEKKFIKGLTPLVQNPSSSHSLRGLVKILSELLIDMATYDHNSMAAFLQAYSKPYKFTKNWSKYN